MGFPDAASAKVVFDDFALVYDDVYRYHREDVVHFVDLAAINYGEHVLDLGCGTGWGILEALKLVGVTGFVTGVDISPVMLRRAMEALPSKDVTSGVTLLEGDITNLPGISALHTQTGEKRRFDVILSQWAFSTLPQHQHEAMLRQWADYLSPGGRIVVDYPHVDEEIAGFETITTEDQYHHRFRLGSSKAWDECRQAFQALAVRAGGFSISRMHEEGFQSAGWTWRGDEITELARKRWIKANNSGDPSRVFLRQTARAVCERWTTQGRERGERSNPRFMAWTGCLMREKDSEGGMTPSAGRVEKK